MCKSKLVIFLCISVITLKSIYSMDTTEAAGRANGLILPDRYNTSLGGYVSALPFVTFESIDDLYFSNLIHARLNLAYYPSDRLSLELAGRLRILTGDQVVGPQSTLIDFLDDDIGYLNLTRAWQAIVAGNIDRASITYYTPGWRITAGRQRINWGTNFVWNPNDWFNAFEYLDFDYEERPGSDALRIQFFTGVLSVLELTLKAAQQREERTYALMYRFNRRGYDLQFQSGLFGYDAAMGFSWSGSIRGGGFRGEVSSYYPVLNDDNGITDNLTFVASLSGDYTYESGLYILGEALYNGYGNGEFLDTIALFLRELSAKKLSPAPILLYGSISYPFNPLVRGTFSVMYNPEDLSVLTMPSIEWSIVTNIDFLFLAQLYYGNPGDVFGVLPNIFALRFRWSF